MSPNAARHLREVIWNTERIIGIEVVAAAQALDLRLRAEGLTSEALGRGTRAAYARVRGAIPFMEQDRILQPDIERAAALVHSGGIVASINTA